MPYSADWPHSKAISISTSLHIYLCTYSLLFINFIAFIYVYLSICQFIHPSVFTYACMYIQISIYKRFTNIHLSMIYIYIYMTNMYRCIHTILVKEMLRDSGAQRNRGQICIAQTRQEVPRRWPRVYLGRENIAVPMGKAGSKNLLFGSIWGMIFDDFGYSVF